VSINYKNGFPDFYNTNYCPIMNYVNGTSGKYKYVNNNLSSSNYDSHFGLANEDLATKFGKGTNSWPAKNDEGFHVVGNYRWDGTSPQFELKNANGVWEKYTWHHVEDGKTIIPVLSNVHSPGVGGFKHAGGNKILEYDFKGVFEFTGY
jgi:hypothetical protein